MVMLCRQKKHGDFPWQHADTFHVVLSWLKVMQMQARRCDQAYESSPRLSDLLWWMKNLMNLPVTVPVVLEMALKNISFLQTSDHTELWPCVHGSTDGGMGASYGTHLYERVSIKLCV
jgi:hypothetical protein